MSESKSMKSGTGGPPNRSAYIVINSINSATSDQLNFASANRSSSSRSRLYDRRVMFTLLCGRRSSVDLGDPHRRTTLGPSEDTDFIWVASTILKSVSQG